MGRPKLDLSDLIDSNVDRFMYLKVRRLNEAQDETPCKSSFLLIAISHYKSQYLEVSSVG